MTDKIELITTTEGLAIASPQPLDRNPAYVYLASLKASGRRPQAQALGVITNILLGKDKNDKEDKPEYLTIRWAALRFQHTAAIRAQLLAWAYKPATANRILSALRGTLRAAWQLGQMSAEELARAVDIKNVPGQTLPAGRGLSPGEISGLMGACGADLSPAGARDAAIIAILYSCGLRRDELVNIALEDYDSTTGELRVLVAKRGKERVTWVTGGADAAMADWLAVRGDAPGPLFQPINKGGKIMPGSMTPQAVYNRLVRRGKQAGIKHFSPHDLRRSFVSDLLDAGADIATVARLAGHSSVNTTSRYDRRPESAKLAATKLLHVPYRRRVVK